MKRVRSFQSLLEARSAAAYLIEHGVTAMVLSADSDAAALRATFSRDGRGGAHDLLVANKADHARGAELLLAFENEPAALEPEWEADAIPDLARLDPGLLPPCPACAEVLPPDPFLEACPRCAHGVDVAELIIERHGPDALADCYVDEPREFEPGVLDRLSLACDRCGYELRSLGDRGECPECGSPFDKHAIIRRLLGE